ncbi:hypothetical protein [Telluribacter sp. SYSU D00476]|uniref:hypothetical protein n=1 Tax=Telluribacter sp. SYSU D00476 TaxID=2811430 RepID=UPI001FF26E22|nr:hypothetical protein [Telluribacter sp. SYSU D00476]
MKPYLLLPFLISVQLFSGTVPAPTPPTGTESDCLGVETTTSEGSTITHSPIEESMYLARIIKGNDTTYVTTIRVAGAKSLRKPKVARLYLNEHKPLRLDGELDYHVQDGRHVYTYTALLDRRTVALLGTKSIKALEIDDYKEEIVKKKSERFRQYAKCLY